MRWDMRRSLVPGRVRRLRPLGGWAVDIGLSSGLEEGLRFEATAFGIAAATEDRREGTRAFLEKRQPTFTGR